MSLEVSLEASLEEVALDEDSLEVSLEAALDEVSVEEGPMDVSLVETSLEVFEDESLDDWLEESLEESLEGWASEEVEEDGISSSDADAKDVDDVGVGSLEVMDPSLEFLLWLLDEPVGEAKDRRDVYDALGDIKEFELESVVEDGWVSKLVKEAETKSWVELAMPVEVVLGLELADTLVEALVWL